MIHELEHHRRQWECQRCKEKVFESKQTLLDHIHSTHKDSSLSGDLLSQVAEVSSQLVVETNAECPFCEELGVEVIRRAQQMGREILDDQAVLIPVEEFQKHIASHQEQLALFAIPQTIERSVDSGSRPDRSEAGADERKKVSLAIDWLSPHHEYNQADQTRIWRNGKPAFLLTKGQPSKTRRAV